MVRRLAEPGKTFITLALLVALSGCTAGVIDGLSLSSSIGTEARLVLTPETFSAIGAPANYIPQVLLVNIHDEDDFSSGGRVRPQVYQWNLSGGDDATCTLTSTCTHDFYITVSDPRAIRAVLVLRDPGSEKMYLYGGELIDSAFVSDLANIEVSFSALPNLQGVGDYFFSVHAQATYTRKVLAGSYVGYGRTGDLEMLVDEPFGKEFTEIPFIVSRDSMVNGFFSVDGPSGVDFEFRLIPYAAQSLADSVSMSNLTTLVQMSFGTTAPSTASHYASSTELMYVDIPGRYIQDDPSSTPYYEGPRTVVQGYFFDDNYDTATGDYSNMEVCYSTQQHEYSNLSLSSDMLTLLNWNPAGASSFASSGGINDGGSVNCLPTSSTINEQFHSWIGFNHFNIGDNNAEETAPYEGALAKRELLFYPQSKVIGCSEYGAFAGCRPDGGNKVFINFNLIPGAIRTMVNGAPDAGLSGVSVIAVADPVLLGNTNDGVSCELAALLPQPAGFPVEHRGVKNRVFLSVDLPLSGSAWDYQFVACPFAEDASGERVYTGTGELQYTQHGTVISSMRTSDAAYTSALSFVDPNTSFITKSSSGIYSYVYASGTDLYAIDDLFKAGPAHVSTAASSLAFNIVRTGLADFDGDGNLDVVAVTGGTTGYAHHVYVYSSVIGASGFVSGASWNLLFAPTATGAETVHDLYIGDRNSDGIDDITVLAEESGSLVHRVYVMDAAGVSYSFSAMTGVSPAQTLYRLLDLNGDGHPEAVGSTFNGFSNQVDLEVYRGLGVLSGGSATMDSTSIANAVSISGLSAISDIRSGRFGDDTAGDVLLLSGLDLVVIKLNSTFDAEFSSTSLTVGVDVQILPSAFEAPHPSAGYPYNSLLVFDMDKDGDEDILVTAGSGQPEGAYFINHGGGFQALEQIETSDAIYGHLPMGNDAVISLEGNSSASRFQFRKTATGVSFGALDMSKSGIITPSTNFAGTVGSTLNHTVSIALRDNNGYELPIDCSGVDLISDMENVFSNIVCDPVNHSVSFDYTPTMSGTHNIRMTLNSNIGTLGMASISVP